MAKPSPPTRIDGLSSIVQIAIGREHICALDRSGQVHCWGLNAMGQLGDGTHSFHDRPTRALVPVAHSIAAGYRHTCALTAGGDVWCWGWNNRGQLGSGVISAASPTPAKVILPEQALEVAAGSEHTCASTASGALWCWGYGAFGQLGDQSVGDRPQPVLALWKGRARRLALGEWHSCAASQANRLSCWGRGQEGQLGDGKLSNAMVPVTLGSPPNPIRELASGDHHVCATTAASVLYCWGDNGEEKAAPQKAGYPFIAVPTKALFDRPVAAVAAGDEHTCVIESGTSHVYCWGYNGRGELGIPPAAPWHTGVPVQVMLPQ
jgi:alpha-tubulin suppressor-like RCC1 family protein